MRAAGQRPHSPVDQDLQNLYNEVWAGFSEEVPAPPRKDDSKDKELDSIYSVYGDTNNISTSINQPTYNGQPYSRPGPPPPPPPPPSSMYGRMPASPTSNNFRRLPPTPGSVSSSSSGSFSMPEPDPYMDSSRPSHRTVDSYSSLSSSSDMLKKATIGNASGRRLPSAPNGQHHTPSFTGSSYGLPSDPRPHHRLPPVVDDSIPSSSGRDGLSSLRRDGSLRPPGALPPTAPGHQGRLADSLRINQTPSFEISSIATPTNDINQYHQRLADSHQYHLPTSHHGGTVAAPPFPPPNPTRENTIPEYNHPAYTPASLSPYSAPSSAYINRSTSGSSTSGFVSTPSITPTYNKKSELYQYEASTGSSSPVEALNRGNSTGSYTDPRSSNYHAHNEFGREGLTRNPSDMLHSLARFDHTEEGLGLPPDEEGEYWEDEEEEDESRFVNFSLLSHMAVRLRDKVPRGTHVKGSIPYPRAFTGKDIVSTIQQQIQRELLMNHGISTNDRRAALQVARSLQSQLFFYEVEWGGRVLQDGVEDVYMFLDDQEGASDAVREREELPTGVVTLLTRCYVPSCGDGSNCYAYACPRKGDTIIEPPPGPTEAPAQSSKKTWAETVDPAILKSIPQSEVDRQTIIHTIISNEQQYVQDLDIVESVFLRPLRMANPPVMDPSKLEDFIDEIFGNILDLRECNRRLLEVMYVRQREQAPVIQRIGDIFLEAATEFRRAYPIYIGQHPLSEKRMKDELDVNPEFRLFLEHCTRQSARSGESPRLDLKHLLSRPGEHLKKYPVLLEAVMKGTAEGNTDADFLREATEAIRNLHSIAQLRTFQTAMCTGPSGKLEWHDLVAEDVRKALSKDAAKRQAIIFELIKGEMAYVKDLENIETMYIQPLRAADPPIISPNRLDEFIEDVFHNYRELYEHHRKLVDKFHEIQREEHPVIRTVTAAVFDAALNFRDSYMEYIPNYPKASYRIDEEMANNPAFKNFVDQCIRHPDAHRLDMKNFINRPIPRLLRYELLLKGIMEESPAGHEDKDAIPHVIDVIKALGKETEPGVQSAKQKVELWRYNSNLVFKSGDTTDMDLLNANRSLIHSGKLLRQAESGLEWSGWNELFVLLFDNYLVMTKIKEAKEREGQGTTKYQVYRRPIPLDLLTLVNFTDAPTQRSTGLLRNLRGERHLDGPSSAITPDSATDSRALYPLTLHHNGRQGGPYILYAESSAARAEWKEKLDEALGLRKIVQESNKVFEVETLSADTFLVPSMMASSGSPAWNQDVTYTGKVTCSVPFNMRDGRGLVAIGCAEGVWIGFRHDPKSMRRVLHLKMVTQCAMLEEFGIFLVLADKSLFAYHIEALVPSSPQNAHAPQVPQKLNGTKDVHFFSVGCLHGRTLIIYMKKKGLDSIFRVLEPVGDKIHERVKAPAGFGSRLGFRSARSEWFRVYRDFFLPSESFDLVFLKARIAILCAKGFEIMDLNDFNSVTIPHREDPRFAHLAKRCESCRPLGMFRSTDDEFLLCYDEFGLYVDKHGDPSRSTGTIEWEGTAERVALHAPYVLLFDSRFIEIRYVDTGRLAQIIPGNDIRCIWDGRGVGSNAAALIAPDGREQVNQEAQVHAVMNAPDSTQPSGRPGARAIAQHVLELIPTIPLYPPGSTGPPAPPPPSKYDSNAYTTSRPPGPRLSNSWRS